jgi:hypothetical protein
MIVLGLGNHLFLDQELLSLQVFLGFIKISLSEL